MRRARPLLLALLLSLSAHLLWLSNGLWSLPAPAPEAEVLRPLTASLRKLTLADSTRSAAATANAGQLQLTRPSAAPVPPPLAREARAEAAAERDASASLAQTAPARHSAPAEVAATTADSSAPSSLRRATEALAALDPVAPAPPPAGSGASDAAAAPAPSGQWIRPEQAIRRFPDQASLHYHAYYGAMQIGSGLIHWQRQGGQYRVEARIKGLFSPQLRYVSEGEAGRQGLRPARYQAWRDASAREYARFDRQAGVLYYGDKEEKSQPLQAGAQDVLSLAFALALGGGELDGEPTQITTGKKVYRYPLKAAGESVYDTAEGRMRIVLVRASADGDVNEYWLAPDFANLPVRIVRADGKKTLELRAHRIDIDGSTIWSLPPRKMKQHEN